MTLPVLPHSTRQQVFTALMNFLQSTVPAPADPVTGNSIPFQTYSQIWEHWTQVPDTRQPAMYLRRGPQTFTQKTAYGVTKLHFRCTVWVYFRTDGYRIGNVYPDQLTDNFIDGFEQAFQTLPGTTLTLSGTVFRCWIDGPVFSDPGLSDKQGVIVVPLSIQL